jgi:membrane protease YdiL (CAAX protease family)
MSHDAALSAATIGPITGVATFLSLTGGHIPLSLPRPLGRAMLVRWLGLGAAAGLEELVWRGIALGGLRALVGPWAALVVSSAGFALWHWPSLRGRCVVHLVTGAAFGAAFLAGGLTAAIAAHALYNVLVDWAVRAARVRPRGP